MRIDFLLELTWRRIIERYIGTSSRVAWVFLSPVLPMLFYIMVFYYIARIPQVQEMGLAAYAAFMFSGLLPFRILQRAIVESCDLLLSNMEMLRTTVFPLSFLTLSAVGALVLEFLVQCAVMAVLLGISGTALTWNILLLPLALATLFAAAVGASWLISIFAYLIRDMQEILSVLFTGLLYVTPIMYPPETAPAFIQKLIWLNPLTAYVLIFRDAILPGPDGIHLTAWVVAIACSATVLLAGGVAIRKAQSFVGDMV